MTTVSPLHRGVGYDLFSGQQARAKLSEMAGLIDRAMQAGQRGLPPGTEKSKP